MWEEFNRIVLFNFVEIFLGKKMKFLIKIPYPQTISSSEFSVEFSI